MMYAINLTFLCLLGGVCAVVFVGWVVDLGLSIYDSWKSTWRCDFKDDYCISPGADEDEHY